MEFSKQEIHQIGMNEVGKHLEQNGFEFLAVKSRVGMSPQFVCLRNEKELYFILVRTLIFPEDPHVYDEIWMQKMKAHAKEKNARLLYAGVGIANSDRSISTLQKGKDIAILYKGLVEISLPNEK